MWTFLNNLPKKMVNFTARLSVLDLVIILAVILSIDSAFYCFSKGIIISYGDAESHLNIAKRVINSLTPGFAQLGGIWLPLPHLMMIPFVYFDSLWRSGFAGWLVSGTCYVVSCAFLYKTVYIVTKNYSAGFIAFLVFALNPNILYLQSTPMTELPLITFFILSTYFFIQFLRSEDILTLIFAAFFGFCATLTRYDGWFLVLMESFLLILFYMWKFALPIKKLGFRKFITSDFRKLIEGRVILFSSLAFFGIFLWLLWGALILGDPFYFSNSQFSARTQQQSWLQKGELPAYLNLVVAIEYYVFTAMENSGFFIFIAGVTGLIWFLIKERSKVSFFIALLLQVPLLFNVISLFLGQSVIFIPGLTPDNFEWKLFNVRYGVMMVPAVAFFIGYLFFNLKRIGYIVFTVLFVIQISLYFSGSAKVISYEDGVNGLSASKAPDAQYWLFNNYDGGLLLLDDYARTISIIRTKIPMQNVIYIGNKPYWEESFREPEKYAKWIVTQKDDIVWKNIYENPEVEGRLFKYFQKVYTSPEILIFKRNENVTAAHI